MNAYEQSLKVLRDNYSIQKTAAEQGEKKGMEKGRKEEKISIARKLKTNGLDFSIIADSTGLTVEEIAKL